MNTRYHLDSYIKQVQKRLRIGAVLRGTAVFTSVALALTVVLVLFANHYAFASWTLTTSRVVLLIALALVIGFGLALPLYGLNTRRAAGKAERCDCRLDPRRAVDGTVGIDHQYAGHGALSRDKSLAATLPPDFLHWCCTAALTI